MNTMNKHVSNPFFNASLLGEDVAALLKAELLESALEHECFKPLKIMFTDTRTHGGELLTDDRLIYVQAPPFKGWSKESLYESLDKFLSKFGNEFDKDHLKVSLGSRLLSLTRPDQSVA